MSDINSSLPVRTEADGDIVAKIGDGTTPSQQLAIDASGRVTATLNDGNGHALPSHANGSQRATDVGTNAPAVKVDPINLSTLSAADVVSIAHLRPTVDNNFTPC